MEYPKINTVFERNEKFKVVPGRLTSPIYEIISKWEVTEKVDGTNIRATLSVDGDLSFGGRTDDAQIHVKVYDALRAMITAERLKDVFWSKGPCQVVLYGEGYGVPVNKGGNYRPDPSFRLFDVFVGEKWWLNWANVSDVASKLGIKTVPYIGTMTLDEMVEMTRAGFDSIVAREDSGSKYRAEGLIGRTVEPLFDKKGDRLILKLKTRDF